MEKHIVVLFMFSGSVWSREWQEALVVHGYDGFHSVVPLKYDVPMGTSLVTWDFRASREPKKCQNKLVDVYLQYGSLPVVRPRNETFPDDFYLHRAHLQHLRLTSDNTSTSIHISWPPRGAWYAVAFRPGSDSLIQQKGLYLHCDYKISSTMTVTFDPHVEAISLGLEQSYCISGTAKTLGFYVGSSVLQYSLTISQCNVSDCGLQVFLFESDNTNTTQVCSSAPCVYQVISPWLDTWHHVQISSTQAVELNLDISTTECPFQDHTDVMTSKANNSDVTLSKGDNSSCILFPALDRFQLSLRDYRVDYLYIVNDTRPADLTLAVSHNVTLVLPFTLRDIDIGGTLSWTVTLDTEMSKTGAERIQVCGTILRGQIPASSNISVLCSPSSLSSNQLQANSSISGSKGQIHVPYPEAGLWFLTLTLQCYTEDKDSGSVSRTSCSSPMYTVKTRVWTDRCLDNECGGHGTCKEYIVGPCLVIYSTCLCRAGWRGYLCSDGSQAYSAGHQLEDLLLPTLSNVFFLPAIVLAIIRGYYTEAIVYTYNMFFSAMYHACDGDRVDEFKFCMIDYSILSFCDFLASVASLWFTIVAMARVQQPITDVLKVGSLLVLPIGVLKDRQSLWLFATPLLCGLVLLVTAWVIKCRTRSNQCYPSKRRYLFCILPGIAIATTGAAVFAFAETLENYRYVHSAWHVCLFSSVLFFLPPARTDEKQSTSGESMDLITINDKDCNQVL